MICEGLSKMSSERERYKTENTTKKSENEKYHKRFKRNVRRYQEKKQKITTKKSENEKKHHKN